jgi:3-ketosteroid 9alpha-monooxygenase subunit B
MKIHVLAPSGTFVPKTLDTDFVLLAAGSGITPMMSICKSALAEGSGKVVLIYANRDENSVIFGPTLRELSAKYPDRLTVVHWLETVQGLPSAASLAALAAPYAAHDAYICGPGPFMAAAEEALKNIGAERIHIEVFKSLDSDPFAAVVIEEDDSDEGPATAIVTLDGQRHEVRWPRNAKLLDVLLDKGLDAPFSCREGHCGACAVLKKSGDVEMEINDVLEQSDLDEGLILGCQARPRSDSVEVTYDE